MFVYRLIQYTDQCALAELPRDLRGLNARLMNQYVEHTADFLLWRLGFPALYGAKNPVSLIFRRSLRLWLTLGRQFAFMESNAIPVKANFFERPVSDYQGAAL